ncbi:unnamed protein product [Rhodiola kirilowii]
MDGRDGGCCIARYGGGGAAYDANKMKRLMLKFRPIAPKPSFGTSVIGSSSSSGNNSLKTSSGETATYVKPGRGKRKYNTNGAKRSSYAGGKRKRVKSSPEKMTLPLLPESPTENKTPTSRFAPPAPIWLSFNNISHLEMRASSSDLTTEKRISIMTHNSQLQQKQAEVVGSVVTVECVTEVWVSVAEERVRNLEWDTCPGFITDAENRVTWTNIAYKKMVVGEEDHEGGGEVVVWVAMKDRVPVSSPAFTCRVRVQKTCSKEVKIFPCDVWRLGCGGFAWRLDVEAALSLGR